MRGIVVLVQKRPRGEKYPVLMARSRSAAPKPPKEPGRIKQMWQVLQVTRKQDKRTTPLLLLTLLVPILLSVGLALWLSDGNPIVIVLWILAGVLAGILLSLIVLARLAERAAYRQIEGQPGAVGAVMRSALRRSWRGSELPVALNPKTQDAVYRAVGRGGVVLISEGSRSRTARMMEDEKRKVLRILPNVPVTFLAVGDEQGSIPLHRLPGTLTKLKKSLTRPEIIAVHNRLSSLPTNSLPIPKGIDPYRVRPQRAR